MEEMYQRQIDEEMNILEAEKDMEQDERYWIWSAIDYLDKANELLYHKGIQEPRDMVLKALYSAKRALKEIEQ